MLVIKIIIIKIKIKIKIKSTTLKKKKKMIRLSDEAPAPKLVISSNPKELTTRFPPLFN
jgi:hypothetical protein